MSSDSKVSKYVLGLVTLGLAVSLVIMAFRSGNDEETKCQLLKTASMMSTAWVLETFSPSTDDLQAIQDWCEVGLTLCDDTNITSPDALQERLLRSMPQQSSTMFLNLIQLWRAELSKSDQSDIVNGWRTLSGCCFDGILEAAKAFSAAGVNKNV
jgi:hypothetical protein